MRSNPAQWFKPNRNLSRRIEDRSKDNEIHSGPLGIDGFVQRVSGNTKQLDQRAHSCGRQTIARQVDSVNTGRQGNIQAIVCENPGFCSCCDITNSRNQSEEIPRWKIFFADLDHVNAIAYRARGVVENVTLPPVRDVVANHSVVVVRGRLTTL